jgi:peptidoglycan hydrolase-like protein with peptidoglycan-binding domain
VTLERQMAPSPGPLSLQSSTGTPTAIAPLTSDPTCGRWSRCPSRDSRRPRSWWGHPIEIHPEWRRHQFFVVRDDIVIVDRSRKVVAVVAVGSSGGAAVRDEGPGSSIALSSEQIRQVQIMLIQKGFNIGEPDGVLGQRTRQALIAFQRQQGLQATGQIDNRTVSALGVNIQQGTQGGGGQPSTSGQGTQQSPADQGAGQQPGGQQQPGQQQGQGGQQPGQGAQQPGQGAQQGNQGQSPTTGQGQSPTTGQGQSPTTGQGGDRMQQQPQQGGEPPAQAPQSSPNTGGGAPGGQAR